MVLIREFTYTFIIVAAENSAIAADDNRIFNCWNCTGIRRFRAALRARIGTAEGLNLELELRRKAHGNYKILATSCSITGPGMCGLTGGGGGAGGCGWTAMEILIATARKAMT
jgi:hypothetical protein